MQQRHIVNIVVSANKQAFGENVNQIDIKIGDRLVVYLENTYDIAVAISEERIVEENKVDKKNLYKIIRKVGEQDLQRIKENQQKAQEAVKIIRRTCRNYELPIKIVTAEYSFDRTKLYVYYTQEQQVNLKKVIHEFAHKFKTRIEMKQIGPRDETKILGGIGVCGYEVCCKRWLKKFESISIEMAKTQHLILNIPKLSGLCNRLKCCLYFEYNFYKECTEKFPKIGSSIQTLDGEGK
ncbi:MAG: stage 0 sporulation protein, partial [Endomicrobia bacterium]|nr:stage 0 sporulation protein [Endomicrobiia bacterium]